MKNKKLTLRELKIKSFVTSINSDFIKAGKAPEDNGSELDTGGTSKGETEDNYYVNSNGCYSAICLSQNDCPSANQPYDCQIQ